MKICNACKEEKSFEDFYYDKSKKCYRWICRLCDKLRIMKLHLEFKQRCVDYKGGECEMKGCGYNKYLGALDFHHRDPKQKDFAISRNYIKNSSWELVEQELDKCILLCSNCHREVHGGFHPHLINKTVELILDTTVNTEASLV